MPDRTPYRPNVVPIHDTIAAALATEAERWTYPMPTEFRLALARAVTKSLQQTGMLNYDAGEEIPHA